MQPDDDSVRLRGPRKLEQLTERRCPADDGHVVLARHSPLDHPVDEAGQVDEEDPDLLNQRLLSTPPSLRAAAARSYGPEDPTSVRSSIRTVAARYAAEELDPRIQRRV